MYDTDSLDEYYKTTHSPSCEYIFTAYGCLVNGKTVCSGYAKAFQFILQNLGYESILVAGEGADGLHAWNMVKIDDDYYYFEVTAKYS